MWFDIETVRKGHKGWSALLWWSRFQPHFIATCFFPWEFHDASHIIDIIRGLRLGYKKEEKIKRFSAFLSKSPSHLILNLPHIPQKWSNLTFLLKRNTFLHTALSFAVWCVKEDVFSLMISAYSYIVWYVMIITDCISSHYLRHRASYFFTNNSSFCYQRILSKNCF